MDLVVSAGGVSALHTARKFGIAEAGSDESAAFTSDGVDTVVIATRHDMHARQVLAALRAGRHVFCEKPLCLTLDELSEIETEAKNRTDQQLMVGFNRRFAPHVLRMKELLGRVAEPKSVIITVNAGGIPRDHWTQDPEVGGGRIIGEACHFIDLARDLVGAPIIAQKAFSVGGQISTDVYEDKASIQLGFADGSQATVHYLANGHKAFPKERVEVFAGGRILQLDNFRVLRGWGWSGLRRMSRWRQDKGVDGAVAAFLGSVREGGAPPIPKDEVFEITRVSIEAAEALR